MKRIAVLITVLAIAGVAAGCGKKGALEPPPGHNKPAPTADKDDNKKPESE